MFTGGYVMPLYEYRCEECGVRFERRQSFSAEPVKVCPECGGNVHRLIGPAGIIFKGSGFYVTDNRKARNSAGVDKKSESDSSPAESTKSDSKSIDKKAESGSNKSEK
jgi:putative FmdB family regulatory protein